MHRFILSTLLLAFIFSTQAAIVQAQSLVSSETSRYNFAEYQLYKRGFSQANNSSGTVVQGQIFQPVGGGFFEPISGVEVSLVGGDDFMANAISDANGFFVFDAATVGEYTVIAHVADTNALGSVSVLLSGMAKVASTTGTPFVTDNLQLVFEMDKNELYILGKKRSVRDVDSATEKTAAQCYAPGGGGGSAGGAFANGGLLLAGLGAAGLATGIAALADDDDVKPSPVTVGAPVNR